MCFLFSQSNQLRQNLRDRHKIRHDNRMNICKQTLLKGIQLFSWTAFLLTVTTCTQKEEVGLTQTITEEEHYYYYRGNQHFIDNGILPDKLLLGFEKSKPNQAIVSFIHQQGEITPIAETAVREYEHYDYKLVIVQLTSEKKPTELRALINQLNKNTLVSFSSFTYQSSLWFGGEYYDLMSYTDEFLVKVNDPNNLTNLNRLAEQTRARIKSQNQFMPEWFTISVDKHSQGDALQMANYFYETGMFAAAEPHFSDFKEEGYK